MAGDFGNQPQQVVAAARERAEQRERRPENGTQAKEAVTFARESIFEREAVADERAILRDTLRFRLTPLIKRANTDFRLTVQLSRM
jgi:hypothetical protein